MTSENRALAMIAVLFVVVATIASWAIGHRARQWTEAREANARHTAPRAEPAVYPGLEASGTLSLDPEAMEKQLRGDVHPDCGGEEIETTRLHYVDEVKAILGNAADAAGGLKGIRPTDAVGSTGSDPPEAMVRVFRDQRIVALVRFREGPYSGLLADSLETCADSGISLDLDGDRP